MKKKTGNNRMRAIVEMAQMQQIEKDGKFCFTCTACGKCCKNRDDIILNPFDLYRMAKHLHMKIEDVAAKYCAYCVGKNSRLPILYVDMKGGDCPFLKDGKCIIHGAKPGVCELYPLGRIWSSDGDKISYFLQPVDCGLKEGEHTAEEWMSRTGIEESEKAFIQWQKMIVPLMEKMELFKTAPYMIIEITARYLLNFMYLNYDTEKELGPQMEKHTADALDFLDEIVKRAMKL